MVICLSQSAPKPKTAIFPVTNKAKPSSSSSLHFRYPISSSDHNSRQRIPPSKINTPRTHLLKRLLNHGQKPLKKSRGSDTTHLDIWQRRQMWVLCGFSYWVQGFRCFPWLALNFHLAHGLGLNPSTLQLVQNTANLPMVAKPLYGVLSDALYIGDAHRLPYIAFGAFLQIVSWGTLVLIPVTGDTFPTQMACILLGNLGASFAEVASDALVAEFSNTQKAGELQSYAFMALAAGAVFGNLSGGFFLLKSQQPKAMFFAFSLLLAIQLALSSTTKETSNRSLQQSSVSENLRKKFSDLLTAINEESIFYPLSWVVASTAIVPLLAGTIFCFQIQSLKLDPSIIGLSKVIGQLVVLAATFVYNCYLKRIPLRKFICGVQILYALSLLSDLILVNQINLNFGFSNEAYVLCLSALAEAIAQFKILPFSVLFASLCPAGCEGSLFAFFASAVCLSSIVNGMFGVGLASLIGVSSADYSGLSLGIVLQFIAALLPIGWISYLPDTETEGMKMNRARKTSTL